MYRFWLAFKETFQILVTKKNSLCFCTKYNDNNNTNNKNGNCSNHNNNNLKDNTNSNDDVANNYDDSNNRDSVEDSSLQLAFCGHAMLKLKYLKDYGLFLNNTA